MILIILDETCLRSLGPLVNESEKTAFKKAQVRPPTKRTGIAIPNFSLVVPLINRKYFQVNDE